MTNLEKFQEVFGIPLDSFANGIKSNDFLCECADANFCDNHRCKECPANNFWDKEYKEVNK